MGLAKFIAGHPGGDLDFSPELDGDYRRFDEHLFRVPEGYWVILRPLAPDEAESWIAAHGDNVLLRQTFPPDESAW